MPLFLERLEARENPDASGFFDSLPSWTGGPNPVPGWTGDVQLTGADVNGDGILDPIAVAQAGGSAHVAVYDGKTQALIGNFIAFDPSFRGGGHVYPAGHDVLVVPGPGGGPIVDEFRFQGGGMQLVSNTLLPFPDEFRGGLQVSSGPVGELSNAPDAFFIPLEGGGPEFVAVNLDTGAVDAQFWVGDPGDLSGDVLFTPQGGSVTDPVTHKLAVSVQQGPILPNGHVQFAREYDLGTGLDVTGDFPTDD